MERVSDIIKEDIKCVCQSTQRRTHAAATYSSLFITACQHDQSLYVLLPDHPPELVDCGGQRTLGGDVLLPGVVTLANKTARHRHPSCSVSSSVSKNNFEWRGT